MKQIRLCYLHSTCKNIQDFLESVRITFAPSNVELIWDEENPEILFATDMIWYHPAIFKKFKHLYPKAIITVYYCSEALSVDFNMFDLAVTYDGSFHGQRYAQMLPPEIFFERFLRDSENTILNIKEAQEELKSKTGFCNFIYSNPKANPYRDQLFHKISEYKKVDSLGRHLNNTGKGGTGYRGHEKEGIDLKCPYKFSIACENSFFHGYTTEKLLTSLQAHTVPIYWGNPDVELDINPECYINCMKYKTMDEVLLRVKEIDEDDELWCKIVSQPWHFEKQKKEKERRIQEYYAFFDRLFSSDFQTLRYRGDGTISQGYRNFFFRHRYVTDYKAAIQRKIKKIINK
jgi:hypothetical protein